MPLDPAALLGAELTPATASWGASDVILYHLGLGAGDPPDGPQELSYVYEQSLKVLPTFAVIPAFDVVNSLASVPGFDVRPGALLHGEQEIELSGPLPVSGSVRTTGRVVDVQDRGSGAVVVVETSSEGTDDDAVRFVNRFSVFVRGEGGFGRTSAPAKPGGAAPERAPDHTVLRRTLPQQALLYRLSGDWNPLHADPGLARSAGFARPILHGLCSLGVTAKTIVDELLDGDVMRVRGVRTRFAGITYPGEQLRLDLWRDGSRIRAEVTAPERQDSAVLTRCAVIVEDEG